MGNGKRQFALRLLTIAGLLLPASLFAEGFSVPDPKGSGNLHWRSIVRYHNPGTFYDTRDMFFAVGRMWSGTQYLGLIGGFQWDNGAQDNTWGLGLGSGFLGSADATNPRILRDSTNGTRIFDFAYANTTGNGYDNLCTSIVDVTNDRGPIVGCRSMKSNGLYEVYLVKFNRYGLVTSFGTDGIKSLGWQTASNHAFIRGIAYDSAANKILVVGAQGTYTGGFVPKVEMYDATTGVSSGSVTNPACGGLTVNPNTLTNATATAVAYNSTSGRYYVAINDWKYNSSTGNRYSYAWAFDTTPAASCTSMANMSHPFLSTESSFATTFNDTIVTAVTTDSYTGSVKVHYAGATRTHTVGPDTAGPFHCAVFHTNSTQGYIGSGAGSSNNWGFVQMPGYSSTTYDGHGASIFNADLSTDGPKYDCILNDVVPKDPASATKTRLFVAGGAYNLGAGARPGDDSITYPQNTVTTGNYDFLSAMLTDNATSLAKITKAQEGPGDDVINKIVPWYENTTNPEMVGIGRTANTQYFAGGMLTFVDETQDWNVDSTTSEPSGRVNHTAIWTGQKMVVWGGNDGTGAKSDGGIYDPIGDTWGAVETTGALSARTRHAAVWDGSEMVVFGGDNNSGTYYADGAKLTFTTSDTNGAWSSLTSMGTARASHALVYGKTAAGTPTIVVWGGWNGSAAVGAGAQYNIGTNAWTNATATGAPTARTRPLGVWDPPNNRALLYGGSTNNTDAGAVATLNAYTPGTDTWAALTSSTTGRWKMAGAYANRYFMIFGGVNTAGTRIASAERYSLSANSWTTVTTTNQPTAREGATGVFTGAEFLVFGGYDGTSRVNTGAIFNAQENSSWTTMTSTGAATAREYASSVWTGERMIVWGGYNGTTYLGAGYQYTPGQVFTHTGRGTWSTTDIADTDLPAARYRHSVVWTGKEMIVWGGLDGSGNPLQSGGRYDPIQNNWAAVNNGEADRPSARKSHTAVWTGTRMIIWGGSNNTDDLSGDNTTEFADGALYNPLEPVNDTWTAVNTTGAPTARDMHTAVWAYSGTNTATWSGKMVIWGGNDDLTNKSDGKYYVPSYSATTDSGTWVSLGSTGKLTDGRIGHAMWFDGKYVGIWGGNTATLASPTNVATGAMLDLGGNTTWTAISTTSAPTARTTNALWTGKYVVMFGENSLSTSSTPFCSGTGATDTNRGARFDPFTGTGGTWSTVSVTGIPTCTNMPSVAWSGSKFMVWGGRTSGGSYLATGALYDPIYDTWTAMSTATIIDAPPAGRAFAPAVFDGRRFVIWGGNTNDAATSLLSTGSRYQR